jgi:hypothetical protein
MIAILMRQTSESINKHLQDVPARFLVAWVCGPKDIITTVFGRILLLCIGLWGPDTHVRQPAGASFLLRHFSLFRLPAWNGAIGLDFFCAS